MTRRHRKILKQSAKVGGGYFLAEGENARLAWELLNAHLIEGNVVKDRFGAPVSVSVLGITLAGREELSRPFSRLTEWLVHALDIALGVGMTTLFNWLLKKAIERAEVLQEAVK